MPDVHWCVTDDYQQIVDSNIANQIHGFTIDYGKFILKLNSTRYGVYHLLIRKVSAVLEFQYTTI